MQAYASVLGIVFGVLMVVLSALITVEALLRKIFSFSLGGVDELSGYAVAIAAPLAFTVALVDNAHIRINQLSSRFPRRLQAVINVLAALSMAVLSVYFLYFTVDTVIQTGAYHSIAQTPWATPLIYPQAVWLVAMAVFPVAAVWLALTALRRLASADWTALLRGFGPASAEDELKAELDDLKRREGFVS